MVVSIKNVSFGYGRLQVLRDVTMNAKEGEIVCLLGPNGAGKSRSVKTSEGEDNHRRRGHFQFRPD